VKWTPAYANGFKTRVANAVAQYLGLDPKKILRNTTVAVHAIQESAMRDIAFLKVQLEADFASNKTLLNEMLKTLGFNDYLKKVQQGNHENLIAFLQMFSKNITTDIRKAIVDAGTDTQLLDRIKAYADPFTQADMKQESLKTSSKEIPAETIDQLNLLYDEGIALCKIASKFYHANPIKKEQFTFSKIARKVNIQVKKDKDSPDTSNPK
jgi:prophage DNA circulation protein